MTVGTQSNTEGANKTLCPLATQESLRLNFAVAVVVFLTYFCMETRLDENLRSVGLAALFAAVVFFDRVALSWMTWAVVSLVLFGGIALRPIHLPNHHFLLAYTSLTFTVCLSAPAENRGRLLQHNFRCIFVALMGIATLQRLFQPSFVSGDYLGMMLALGEFLEPVLKLLPSTWELIQSNHELMNTLRSSPPAEFNEVILTSPFPRLPFVAKFFMFAILASEAWLCFCMWRFPKSWITYLSIMAFGISLSVLRQELTFIALLCLLTLFTIDHARIRLRRGYAVMVILFAAAVIKTW